MKNLDKFIFIQFTEFLGEICVFEIAHSIILKKWFHFKTIIFNILGTIGLTFSNISLWIGMRNEYSDLLMTQNVQFCTNRRGWTDLIVNQKLEILFITINMRNDKNAIRCNGFLFFAILVSFIIATTIVCTQKWNSESNGKFVGSNGKCWSLS